MEIKKILLTNNDCYKAGKKIVPKGIIVHSTGSNNKTLKRYISPNDGIIGENKYKNHWNRAGVKKCVHAFIGTDAANVVRIYQTLPFDFRAWGIGSGKKGTYNNSYIQFEICEDALKDEKYFNEAFNAAIDLCVYLMHEYPDIKIENVISHHEGYLRGMGSNHGDCDHWLAKFGKNMDWFRSAIEGKMQKGIGIKKNDFDIHRVKVTALSLRIRAGASTSAKTKGFVKRNEVYTIIEEKGGWGKLKSGAGWISLKYTKKC